MFLLDLSHTKMNVFVGPFTYKNEEISDNDDIACLNDDNQNKEKAVTLLFYQIEP